VWYVWSAHSVCVCVCEFECKYVYMYVYIYIYLHRCADICVGSSVKHTSLDRVVWSIQSSCIVGQLSVECLLWKRFKPNGSATVTQRVFRRYFDIGRNGKIPTRQTILNWVTQFRTTASIVNKKPSGRPRTVRTPENVRAECHMHFSAVLSVLLVAIQSPYT
jgi:hypothetical protein